MKEDSLTEEEAKDILRKHAPDERTFGIVLRHSLKGQEISLRIAKKINKNDNNNVKVDEHFIKTACILHDIGRFRHPPGKQTIKHGIAGAEIMRKLGFEKIARVCERHLGVGISKQDIKQQGLDIPLKDYMPETIEEKIIAYADNLAFGDKECTIQELIERFVKEIGPFMREKIIKLHNEIEELCGGENLL